MIRAFITSKCGRCFHVKSKSSVNHQWPFAQLRKCLKSIFNFSQLAKLFQWMRAKCVRPNYFPRHLTATQVGIQDRADGSSRGKNDADDGIPNRRCKIQRYVRSGLLPNQFSCDNICINLIRGVWCINHAATRAATVLFRPVITIAEEAAFEAVSLGSGTPVR